MSEVTIGTGAGQPKGVESAKGGVVERLVTIELTLTTLQVRVTTLETQVDKVRTAVTKLETRMDERFQHVATKADVYKALFTMMMWSAGFTLTAVGLVLKFG